MDKVKKGVYMTFVDSKVLFPETIVQIRYPIPEKERSEISKVLRFFEGMPVESPLRIAGKDRGFDVESRTYGNSFTDFDEWPSDKPMDVQQNAEYFLNMCFTDAVVRMNMNKVLTDDQADSIIWMARKGLLIAAAATVNYILNKKKGETTDGSGGT
jgi:hypothetical protein